MAKPELQEKAERGGSGWKGGGAWAPNAAEFGVKRGLRWAGRETAGHTALRGEKQPCTALGPDSTSPPTPPCSLMSTGAPLW